MVDEKTEKKIWALFEEGLSDNEILDKLVAEGRENITYMDLRILRADYEEEHPESIEQSEEETEPVEESIPEEPASVVELDSVKKPGAIISGKAHFPSGAEAEWALDKMGRISVQPTGKQEPTQSDMQVFQQELQKEIKKRGGVV